MIAPSSPNRTFTIDYHVPVRDDHHNTIEILQGLHEQAFTSIIFQGCRKHDLETPSPSTSTSTPSDLLNRSDVNIWRQPEFDMASAESLLQSFRSIVSYLPFIQLPESTTVSGLATTQPFVLLAILTVASGSRMVQKHALYDGEFRKALSLKYVSGGERSLELLQGLLIYCAWYPFHLRPNNRQLVHCLRIVGDLVHDLHLDENYSPPSDPLYRNVADSELDKIRAYLAYIYLSLTYVAVWRGKRDLPISRVSWTRIALETLQHNTQDDGDNTLIALVRSSSLFADVSETMQDGGSEMSTDCQVILRRLEQEFLELQPATNQRSTGLVSKTYSSTENPRFCPPLPQLYGAVGKIKTFLDFVLRLDDASLLSFTINDWTRLIVALTLSFRLSFPLPLCPDFDSAYARAELQLGCFLGRMSQGSEKVTQSDLLSASRCVLGLAKSKYDIRLDLLGKSQSTQLVSHTFGCPIMHGNFATSIDDGQFDPSGLSEWIGDNEHRKFPLFHDIWATMTMGW
ncbi:hypothetical protein F53441_1813 [Fusarium austroafricanum]|uniref:Transcription factor domain-containing protein n=1 Tax=Fusarium austroafricanum TaxID=2364996 RepID=A0A8H4KSN3_9HYPO|nr:hypothetical protein F53441_1813 [Fusarium austroafricanum]